MSNFRIVSWNVQGLGGAQAQKFKTRIKQDLHKTFMRSADMVFLQECHLILMDPYLVVPHGSFLV